MLENVLIGNNVFCDKNSVSRLSVVIVLLNVTGPAERIFKWGLLMRTR